MEVVRANQDDVVIYTAFAREAQAWLRRHGYRQYVPAAHDEYAGAIKSRVEAGTLHVVRHNGETIGFFGLDESPSPWWSTDGAAALYLSGMVIALWAQGRGIGRFIIEWCVAEAARLGRQYVRLDCHAGNSWLCQYYETHHFELRGQVEQHPGYFGCLYQRDVSATAKPTHSS